MQTQIHAALLALLILSGCATAGPREEVANNQRVLIQAVTDEVGPHRKRAKAFCHKHYGTNAAIDDACERIEAAMDAVAGMQRAHLLLLDAYESGDAHLADVMAASANIVQAVNEVRVAVDRMSEAVK